MSRTIQIEDVSRREAIRRLALFLGAAGLAAEVNPLDAQQVHAEARKMKGALGGYQRQFFTEHEWKTVSRLADLIVPADHRSGGAVDAGAPEYIDLLCSGGERLGRVFTGGLSWLDAETRARYGKEFIEASEEEQTALLDAFVAEEKREDERRRSSGDGPYAEFRDYQAWDRSEIGPGVKFFDWVRKMSVDAFYTSPIGVKDLGYMGNGAYSEYKVPQESIDYAMSRGPFAASDD